MVERICESIRSGLALGEPATPGQTRHIAGCEVCRIEVDRMRRVLVGLGEVAEVEVPAALDRSVRARLLQPAVAAVRPFSRPSLAAGLAVGGLIALIAALAGALAETGAAEQGAYLALVVALGYTTLSAAAAFPLLLMRKREVRR